MSYAFLYEIPAWLLFIFMVCGAMGLSWIGTLLVRRRTKAPKDDRHNEVAGFIFTTAGVVYAVLLAFVVIIVWEQYLNAESAVSQEGAALIAVGRDASSFPEPARSQAYDQLHAYVTAVTTTEWETVDQNALARTGVPALVAFNKLWIIYRQLPPNSVDAHTTQSLDELSAGRVARLLANEATVPDVLWVALVLGGVITICFCLILHMENAQLHAIMTALLAALIATCLWLIVVINHPFSGDLRLSTDALQHALYVIDTLPR